jgi:hypothetical protein
VDATWDSPLKKAGFPVNDHWDGYSEMKRAVKPLKFPVRTACCSTQDNESCREKGEAELCQADGEKNHWNSEDQVRYYCEKEALRNPDEAAHLARFYQDFEAWLVDARQQKKHALI